MEATEVTEEICASAEELAPRLYPDLRRAARGIRRQLPRSGTLQTTALIHEAYLKVMRGGPWASQRHFLAAAAVAMRHVLIDQARSRSRLRRGEGVVPMSLEDALDALEDHSLWSAGDGEVELAIGEALDELAKIEPRLARVVECRYFAGYTEAETADILGVADRTVRRDWVKARAWLQHRLADYSAAAG
ncbi:MAG: sigma-70 family RNA polymerase sigma factor [Gammaproteobacteria bacterium]|nr:sigma-70 family RNA polymerase sigma factor [Gammaproteobacteria bacterium]